jgi:hypothetical protein
MTASSTFGFWGVNRPQQKAARVAPRFSHWDRGVFGGWYWGEFEEEVARRRGGGYRLERKRHKLEKTYEAATEAERAWVLLRLAQMLRADGLPDWDAVAADEIEARRILAYLLSQQRKRELEDELETELLLLFT